MANKWFEANYGGYATSGYKLALHVYTVETNQNSNYTKERADLYLKVSNAQSGWYNLTGSSSGSINVNGHSTGSRSVKFDGRSKGDKLLIGTWDTTVTHNDNGTKSITVSASHSSGVGLGNASISGSYTCDTIPRYASFTQHYVKSKTLNSVTMYWSANKSITAWQHSINGGGWQNCDGGNTYVISGLQPNTTYNIRTRIQSAESGLWTESGTVTVTTYDIARFTNNPTVTVGDKSVTLTFNNPSGSDISAVGIELRDNSGTEIISSSHEVLRSPFVFEFTDIEIGRMYNYFRYVLTNKFRFYITTTQGDKVYETYMETTFNLDKEKEKPIFENFVFEDVDTQTKIVTGGGENVVKGYSDIKVTIPINDRAIALTGTNISGYRIIIGNEIKTIGYSMEGDVYATFENVSSPTVIVRAIDERGLQTELTKTGIFYDYQYPYISELTVKRENGVGTKVLFTLDSTFFNSNFPAGDNQVKLYYRYKPRDNRDYSDWYEITSFDGIVIDTENGTVRNTTDNMNFIPKIQKGETFEHLPEKSYNEYTDETYDSFGSSVVLNEYLEFELGVDYDIQFKLEDLFTDWTKTTVLDSGIPCTAKRKNENGRYSIGVNKFPDDDYAFDVLDNTKLNGTDMDLFFIRNDGPRVSSSPFSEGKYDINSGNSQIFSNCLAYEQSSQNVYGILFATLGALNPSGTVKFLIKGYLCSNEEETEFEVSFYGSSYSIRDAKCKINNTAWLKDIYVCNSDSGITLGFVHSYDEVDEGSYDEWNDTVLIIDSMFTSYEKLDLRDLEKEKWLVSSRNDFLSFGVENKVKCSKYGDIYSTEEIDTGKTWIDGKPIYRKCFKQSSLSNIATNISNLDCMLQMKCIVRSSLDTLGTWRTIPWLFNANNLNWMGGFYYQATDNTIIFQVGSSLGSTNVCIVILEYTKSTGLG